MAVKWLGTRFPGVRYYEHPERKHGVRRDRYYTIRLRVDGKATEEGLGWASEGWSETKAATERARLQTARKTGEGPVTLSEKRNVAKAKREAQEARRLKEERERITFRDVFLDHYFPAQQGNKHPRSIAREEQCFRLWILPAFGDTAMKAVTPFDLERLKKQMLDAGRAPATVRYALATVRQCFNFARRHGLIEVDSPTDKVRVKMNDNRRLRYLTKVEASLLMDHLKARSTETWCVALVSLHCGLRYGEIRNLCWSDVDTERSFLTIRDPKGKTNRTVYMTEEVKRMFQSRAPGSPSDNVFEGKSRGGKSPQVSKTFNRSATELRLNEGISDPRQKVVFHTLRHTFASWLAEAGVDIYTIATILGHKELKMTQRYSHLGNGAIQRAVLALENELERNRSGPAKTKAET